jgi:hypothetical protein
MEKFSPATIFAPAFSSSELCAIAGIDRKLANLWLERGLIEPSRIEQLAVRSRPYFSCVAIFKARLTRELSELFDMSSSSSQFAGIAAELANNPSAANATVRQVVHVAASPGWLHGHARAVERGKPLNFYAGLSRKNGCWEFRMDMDVRKLAAHFGKIPFMLFPIGAIFDEVYLACKAAAEGSR